ncbi:hypothetical protein A2634_04605 [Candidatus Amesbacteria bacterium RIFCSPHIGHO2_01_FULL_48_32]|uniref:Uncharacterized protein n=1 Tax=Candidatus Amesbacteria bacterium RIFCSPLOWO2_01_FULL_48_25 TaxID=1797259 RepID=A0A1F4ZCC0_9BACT|nr:MAG: hypothetical protein A2634_04605 [Candidatus Amesbacteria bacterium RIFCSPHIGHO2_01_FULL_48_32]OGD03818.1 MAG: hypothetical protein A2989_04075 [Candidatus Amesbacteria bacterium RIFCSPLOWO2_01_FULL_48_25]
MPSINLDLTLSYIRKMTDKTGILEHAKLGKPDIAEGYTTDDNARAYQVMLKLGQPRKIYLDFLRRAANVSGFHNEMDILGQWVDKPGLGEWFGRAVVAAGRGIKSGDRNEKMVCRQIWDAAKSQFDKVTSPRTIAQLAIAGVPHMTDKLVAAWKKYRSDDWEWFEPGLYYDNGRLPHALFITGYEEVGRKTLDWLIDKLWSKQKNCFSFVGQTGWWKKGEAKAEFDQQPVEAGSIVEACAVAYSTTKDKKYLDWAHKAWQWYSGRNIIGEKLIDSRTGGIRDGFSPQGCSLNEGAEAVLSFVIAHIALEEVTS